MQKDEKTLVTTWVFLSVTRKDTLQKFISTNMKSKIIKGSIYLFVTKNVERPDFFIISSIGTIAKSSLMYLRCSHYTN